MILKIWQKVIKHPKRKWEKVSEEFQSQIDDKDMVIDTVNDDLEDDIAQHSTCLNDGDNETECNSLKFKFDNCSFEGKTMKGLFYMTRKLTMYEHAF